MSDDPDDSHVGPRRSLVASFVSAMTQTHAVPKRFGVAGILAVTAGMAILFALLRLLRVPPVGFLFIGLMAVAICAAQMVWGKIPRVASCIAGAVLLSLLFVVAAISDGVEINVLSGLIVGTIIYGAILGYVMGTLFAGVFVIMAKLDPYLPGGRDRASKQNAASTVNTEESV